MRIKGQHGFTLLLGGALAMVTTLVAIEDSNSAVRGWIERSDEGGEQHQPEQASPEDPSEHEDTGMEEELANEQPAEETISNETFTSANVARPTFTTDVVDREPVDNLSQLSLDAERVYFFTELRNMTGQTAVHRWEYGGDIIAEVEFDVGGPRWRVWSSKSLQPQWAGTWTVSVLNTNGELIGRASLEYTDTGNGF